MNIIDDANKIVCREDKYEGKCKFTVMQIMDEWCERVSDFHEEHDKEDISIMLKVDSELEGYWLMVAYPNGKVLRDYICEEAVQDCYKMMKEEEPQEDHSIDEGLMVCVGWRIDSFRDNGYEADWLDDEEYED